MPNNLNVLDCADCPSLGDSIFCNLKKEVLKYISKSKDETLYKKGQIVFNEGVRPLGLHCVATGRVKVYKLGVDGKDQIVRVANSGDIIGYRSLLSNENYSSSAKALVETRTCFIPKSIFFELVENNNEFALNIMRIISKALRSAEFQSMNIAQTTVRQRLADTLLSKKDILEEKKGITVMSFTISRKDLSDLIGCAPETVIRMLSELKKEGVISLHQRKVEILNEAKLYKIAHRYS